MIKVWEEPNAFAVQAKHYVLTGVINVPEFVALPLFRLGEWVPCMVLVDACQTVQLATNAHQIQVTQDRITQNCYTPSTPPSALMPKELLLSFARVVFPQPLSKIA